MSKESNTIELSTRHQLVDLNKNLVNFKLDFQVISPENKDFYTIILNQNEIDSYENMDMMEMKKAPGKISGTIIADNNEYKNYFIILKSDEPHKVDVITTIEEIPPKEEESDLLLNSKSMEEEAEAEPPFYKTRGCWILILLIGLLVIYYFKSSIFKKKDSNVQINVNPKPVTIAPISPAPPVPTTGDAPSIDNLKPLTTKLIQQEN
jgi:hypothetical protein